MGRGKGIGLVEVIVVMVIAGLLITAGVAFALPWLEREDMRGALYQLQTHLQLARVQAITRNRACQFRLDATTGRIQVIDLNDPADDTDDTELTAVDLPGTVRFIDPGGGTPITLALLSGRPLPGHLRIRRQRLRRRGRGHPAGRRPLRPHHAARSGRHQDGKLGRVGLAVRRLR